MIPQDTSAALANSKPHRRKIVKERSNGRAAVVLQHNESVVTAADEMMEGNSQERPACSG